MGWGVGGGVAAHGWMFFGREFVSMVLGLGRVGNADEDDIFVGFIHEKVTWFDLRAVGVERGGVLLLQTVENDVFLGRFAGRFGEARWRCLRVSKTRINHVLAKFVCFFVIVSGISEFSSTSTNPSPIP
jgi:hypothetical protein